ncbi:zinc finger protein 2 homolog isoform X1 [Octodon degus]|uniref:Zinc finger protein 2 homolog isoform X1 n=2 Tax=Octodon degus TaxID=10160 RepID=A0A6P6ECS9_OCTDE|nr:zinc finger protein 2 homolog isoform X1 [Octodon degus]
MRADLVGFWRHGETLRAIHPESSVCFQEEQTMRKSPVLVSFDDVFVSFTREEWQVLDNAQRALYGDVMLETYRSLVLLGQCITKPEVIFKLEQGVEPWTGGEPHNQSPPDVQEVDYTIKSSHNSEGRCLWQVVLTTNNTSVEERVRFGFELKVLESNFGLSSNHWIINPGNSSAVKHLLNEPAELGAGEELGQCHLTGKSLRCDEHFRQYSKILTGQQDFQSGTQWKAFTKEAKLLKECITQEKGPMGQACWDHIESGEACEKPALIATVGGKPLYKNCDLTTHQTHIREKSCESSKCEKDLIVQQKKYSEKDPCAFDQCEKSSYRRSYITVQQSFSSEEKLYECDECEEAFQSKSGLMKHKGIHTWGKLYACKECGKSFCRKSGLTIHEKIHSGEKPYQCTKCTIAFRKKSQLRRHWRRIHTEEKTHECNECGKVFYRLSQLIDHQRVHTGEKPYECGQCGKSFGKKMYLTKHQHRHTGEKPYKCSHCGKSYSQKIHLTQHETVHTREKPYECNKCGKFFGQKTYLIKHQMTHTEEKPYGCDQCGKFFSQKIYLTNHKVTHIVEKPYKCSDCGKSFAYKSYLTKHLLTHTGEKPYGCDQCGKFFSQKTYLMNHKVTHIMEKPYKCNDCGKSFAYKSYLTKHLLIHTGEKPYGCNQCGKTFRQISYLSIHERTKHGKEAPVNVQKISPVTSPQTEK